MAIQQEIIDTMTIGSVERFEVSMLTVQLLQR